VPGGLLLLFLLVWQPGNATGTSVALLINGVAIVKQSKIKLLKNH